MNAIAVSDLVFAACAAAGILPCAVLAARASRPAAALAVLAGAYVTWVLVMSAVTMEAA